MATIANGTFCALLASLYETTIAKSILLAFFLTLVLALGESVRVQSMTVTIQALRATRPTWRWFLGAYRREIGTSVLRVLGIGCGLLVGLIVWLWRASAPTGAVIGGSIFMSLGAACAFGLGIPALLHALKLDPQIAAGPLTLALTDIVTLLFYFNFAMLFL